MTRKSQSLEVFKIRIYKEIYNYKKKQQHKKDSAERVLRTNDNNVIKKRERKIKRLPFYTTIIIIKFMGKKK